MMQNLLFDPVKRDYVFKDGAPIPTDRVLEPCYYSLMIPQNKWLYGQEGQGSLLYTLMNAKRTAAVEQLFASYSRDAIQRQVIDTGLATAVSFKNLDMSRTGTSNQLNVTPSKVQISAELNFVSV